ncbi:MAG: hypothetical protein C4567_08445 [Deltaproteobacteria bacterium]|nr:MAG: hypothetical protein C4567_08445 [Deltaproteobacteria bacterium]
MKWCDLSCDHASFPQTRAVDGAGSCNTFQALHCAKLERLVYKNAPCPCRETAGSSGENTSKS